VQALERGGLIAAVAGFSRACRVYVYGKEVRPVRDRVSRRRD